MPTGWRPLLRSRGFIITVAVVVVAVVAVTSLVIAGIAPSSPGIESSGTASPTSSEDGQPSPATPATTDPNPSPEQPSPTAAPIQSSAEIEPGLVAELDRIEAVEGTSDRPGEIAGPALRFAVVLTNGSSATVDLQSTAITVDYGLDRTPAGELSQPGGSPLQGLIAPGSSAAGVYIFNVPVDQRDLVRITVDFSTDVAPLVFEGAVPR